MAEALIAGSALGITAGLVPGPFVAFVAATAMEQGLRAGLKVTLAPFLVETPVMLVTVVVLSQLPDGFLRWAGIVGGTAVAVLGVFVIRRAGRADTFGRTIDGDDGTGNLLRLAGVGLLSPAPWVFWTAIGGPLLLRSWHRGPTHAASFLAAFFGLFVGGQVLVAVLASRGVRLLDRSSRRRVMRGVGVVLVVAGIILAWQAWTGNFSDLVGTQQRVEQLVN